MFHSHLFRRVACRVAFLLGFVFAAPHAAAAPETLRLGWQTPWATQGQLVSVLQRTNIPDLVGLDLQYTGFSYGAPLNRAALAGSVDVLLTADQPAAALIDKGGKFKIVGRMMYNRTCVYTHPSSRIKSLADLKQGRVMGPSGAAAERIAANMLNKAGVDAAGITWGDLDMAGQAALLRGAAGAAWTNVDALYGFDPLPAVWEQAEKVRSLGCGRVVSFVVASKELIDSRPQALAKFLRAFSLAWHAYAKEPARANAWFKEISGLDIPDEALERSAAIEPNKAAKRLADIDLQISDEDRATFSDAAEFLRKKGLVNPGFVAADAFALQTYTAVKRSLPEWAGLAEQVAPRRSTSH